MATSSYENGWSDGQWTPAFVWQCGFRSAQECLVHQEQVYQDEVKKLFLLRSRNPAHAQKQAEYMEGWIAGARQSLGSMR